MATNKTNSEAAVLEQYRVSLENVKNQPTISSLLDEFGYTPEVIAVGESLFANTLQVYTLNKTEDDETSAAYAVFNQKKSELAALYKAHRKKAKVVFRNEPVTLDLLAVSGNLSGAHVKWMETVKKFYAEVSNNTEIKTSLARFKVTGEEISQAISLITEVETARATYLREVGESEDTTQQKDAAFSKLDVWMSDFYAVAKIALEDHPQLLESLGKSVRS
ncbi:MAG: hypothetical protein AB7U05_15180 [Mangrovibacterium sp.]